MPELIEERTLPFEPPLEGPPATDLATRVLEGDERLARRALRGQIAAIERQLGALFGAAYPRRDLDWKVGAAGGPRLLGIGELEALRDSLAGRLQDLRRTLAERGYAEQSKRELIERMLVEPERHRWVRVSNQDIGEPGCRHWHSRPRWGLLGMLMGWWRVKVSSGCP